MQSLNKKESKLLKLQTTQTRDPKVLWTDRGRDGHDRQSGPTSRPAFVKGKQVKIAAKFFFHFPSGFFLTKIVDNSYILCRLFFKVGNLLVNMQIDHTSGHYRSLTGHYWLIKKTMVVVKILSICYPILLDSTIRL